MANDGLVVTITTQWSIASRSIASIAPGNGSRTRKMLAPSPLVAAHLQNSDIDAKWVNTTGACHTTTSSGEIDAPNSELYRRVQPPLKSAMTPSRSIPNLRRASEVTVIAHHSDRLTG